MLLALARDEPALFLQRFPAPVLIDEIQYAPGLLPLIKEAVDASGGKGLVCLTGSQPFHLMKNVGESLAGRVAVMQLQGLSMGERLGIGGKVAPFLPSGAVSANTVPADAVSPLAWCSSRFGAVVFQHCRVMLPQTATCFTRLICKPICNAMCATWPKWVT